MVKEIAAKIWDIQLVEGRSPLKGVDCRRGEVYYELVDKASLSHSQNIMFRRHMKKLIKELAK